MKWLENKSIVAMLKRYEEESAVIEMAWDAGGDQTPIWTTVNGKNDYSPKDRTLFENLHDRVIDALSLPGAGDRYNSGSGILYTKEDKIILRTSYISVYEKTSDYDRDDFAGIELSVQLPDPYNWSKLIKRASIDIYADLYKNDFFNFNFHLRIRHGDNYTVTNEQEEFYKEFMKTEMEKLKQEFDKVLDGYPVYKLQFHSDTISTGFKMTGNVIRVYAEILSEEIDAEIIL